MNVNICRQCKYYRQHYTLDDRRIFRVYCGHCIFSRAKRKLPDAKACENFIEGMADEAAFAQKEYLSKELLQYLLHLELLPPIEDRTEETRQNK